MKQKKLGKLLISSDEKTVLNFSLLAVKGRWDLEKRIRNTTHKKRIMFLQRLGYNIKI
jgi:hypothetical protein